MPAQAATEEVRSGALTATVRDQPFSISFRQRGGPELVATAVTPGARVSARPAGEGACGRGDGTGGDAGHAAEFDAPAGERFYGFGERSDAVERRGREAENYVADGPVRPEDSLRSRKAACRRAPTERADATYFPVPWLLSTRGYGVLVDEDATSRFATTAGGRAARTARGPRCACSPGRRPPARCGASRRRRAPARAAGTVDVRPVVPDRPAQRRAGRGGASDHGGPARGGRAGLGRRDADALPAVRRAQGREAAERERTDSFHRDGLARLVYFNPLLCVSYRGLRPRGGRGRAPAGPGGAPFS